eukprot:s3681_g4.t1
MGFPTIVLKVVFASAPFSNQPFWSGFPAESRERELGRRGFEPPALLVAAVCRTPAVDRATLLELYSKHVLEAKKVLSDFALRAWSPVAAQSSAEEFSQQLLPTALRMTKRQPAASAVSFPSMVGSVQLDLSAHAKELLETAPEKLKDKDRRLLGRGLVKDVAKASSSTALLAVAESWAELVKKAGKVDEKQAALQALAELASHLPAIEDASMVAKLIDPKGPLAKVAAEDANEETRFFAYRALGAIALALPPASQDQVVQELLKPLSDKKAPDRARLGALTCLALLAEQREGSPCSWAGSFVDKVLPLLTLAATKPVQRLQSLLGFAVCGSLSKADGEALGAKMKKEQLTLLKESTSFLNAVPIIQKAPHAELAAQAQFWRAVLAGQVPGSPSVQEAAQGMQWLSLPPSPFVECMPVVRSTIVLLASLHTSSPERSVGQEKETKPTKCMRLTEVLKDAKEDANTLLLLLSQALLAWLAEQSSLPPLKRQVSSAALRETLVELCKAAAAVQGSLIPEVVCLLSLAAHHPLLASRRWPTMRHWRWLQENHLGQCFGKAGPQLWASLRQLIFAGRQLPGTDGSGCRQAAISAAQAFDDSESVEEVKALLQDCLNVLPADQVVAEKVEDVKVFFAPEGVLWIEEGVYVAEERNNKNVSKNKYLQDMDEEEPSAAPASRIKFAPRDKEKEKTKDSKPKDVKDKAKGKGKAAAGAEKGAMTQSQIEEAKIQEQSDTRARIRCYVDEANFAMDVIASLAKNQCNKEAIDEAMCEMVPSFLKLLQSPLTVLKARQCLRSLVQLVVPPTVMDRRDLLADALMIIGKRWLNRSPAAAGTPGDVRVCEVVLSGIDGHQQLTGSTLALVLPLIIRALFDSSSQLQDLCTKALQLLEKQLSLGIKVPEETAMEIFDSLSVVLLALPGMANLTQAAMVAASKNMISSTDQLVRLADLFFSNEDLMRSSVISALAALPENINLQGVETRPKPAKLAMSLRRNLATKFRQFLPIHRPLSTQVATTTAEQLTSPKSLSELSERAGFVPRPPEPEKDPKPGFRGGKALFIFFLCNAVPFSAIMYYLREQREKRTEMAMLVLPKAPEEVAAEVLRVIRTAAVCFLLQDSQAATGNALRVDPHPPEATAYVPPTGPLPIVPQMERNFLTDMLESPAVVGLGFVHFALSRHSQEAQAIMAGRRTVLILI